MDKSEKNEIESLISFGDAEETEEIQPEVLEDEDISEESTAEEDVSYETEPVSEENINDTPEEEDIPNEAEPDTDDLPEENAADIYEDFPTYTAPPKKKRVSKRARRIKYAAIAAAVIAAIVAFSVIDTGFIGAYKRNFAKNFSHIFGITYAPKPQKEERSPVYVAEGEKNEAQVYKTDIKSSVIIPYDYASDSEYSAYAKGIVCASTNYMCYINDKGETEWERATSVVDPILRTAGNYILITQRNGTKLCLYNGSELVYDIDCDDNILNASLSHKGDCVLVTTKDLYKGAIAAYNRSGKLIYSRFFGDASVIDAAISAKSRNIAVALLDTDEALLSRVEIFDIMENEPQSSVDFENTILFDVEYFGNIINAFGDNGIISMKKDGEVIFDNRFDDADIAHYAYDKNGNKIVLLDYSNVPTIGVYNIYGKQKLSATIPELSDYVSIDGKSIMYNLDREIVTGKANGKKLLKYTASMDIRELVMINKNMFFIVYSNSIELVRK